MTEKKLSTIADFCKDKDLSLKEFSDMTNISYSKIMAIKDVTNPYVGLQTIIKIWTATRDRYGAGNALACVEWLDLPKFWEK